MSDIISLDNGPRRKAKVLQAIKSVFIDVLLINQVELAVGACREYHKLLGVGSEALHVDCKRSPRLVCLLFVEKYERIQTSQSIHTVRETWVETYMGC